jgi:hypothetical protein
LLVVRDLSGAISPGLINLSVFSPSTYSGTCHVLPTASSPAGSVT